MQIRSFQEVKIFKYTYCEKDGSRTDTKSRMKHFVLVINGWRLLIIVKKNLHINVYIVFIYMNVELLSNVDKRNTLRSRNNNDVMPKN